MDDRRGNDFSMALANLGEPDEQIASWWESNAQFYHGYRPGDPGFAKWIVQESPRGERELFYDIVVDGYEVEVHFTGKTLDGTVFASSRDNDAPLTFIPTQGFSLAVSSMHGGEKALFIIPTQLALTKSGCPATVPWNIPPNQTLWFDIELISITTDILGDQGIMKKTTKFGAGEQHPCDLDEVSVKYNACLMDGTLLSKSEGVEFSLVDGFFCSAFVHAVKTMTEGDEAFLIIKPEWPSKGNEAAVPPDATLHVNLQLMSWKTVSLIGEDQKIVKTTFGRANFRGKQAQRGAVMKVRLIGKLQDGIVFDRRGDDGDEPFEFTIDEEGRRTGSTDENFVSGLEEAVMTMEEGEVASVIIPPQHAYGTVGSNKYPLAVIPPNSVLIYEIELLSINIIDEMVMFGLSRRKLKQGRQRGDQDGMIVVPPAAWPQGNASHQPPVLAPPAAGVAQSPPAIIGATTTIDPSTGTASKRTPGLGSCFGFSSSSAN